MGRGTVAEENISSQRREGAKEIQGFHFLSWRSLRLGDFAFLSSLYFSEAAQPVENQ